MRTIEHLTEAGGLFWPAVVATAAVGLLGGVLAPIVVAKRLAFVGQGVSHAAFGGIGLAAWLGLMPVAVGAEWPAAVVVGVFCVASALGMAWLSDRRGRWGGVTSDTAVGVFLVGSIALGAILLRERLLAAPEEAASLNRVDAWLFGTRSLLTLDWPAALAVWGALLGTAGALWWRRRSVVFWTVDEAGAETFGVRTGVARTLVMALVGIAVLVTMRLTGALLATSVLVLPGASAMLIASGLRRAWVWSIGLGGVSALGGLVLSFEMDWPPGPSIVAAQVGVVAVCWVVWRARGRRMRVGRGAGAT